MTSWAGLVRAVAARAGDRCEYCRMHQALQGATFHVEHTVPSSHGGADDLANLAWACPACNLHKADRTSAVDPDSGTVVPLFNPRTDCWSDHFAWQEYKIVGLTPIGRAAILALDLNHSRRVMIRRAEEMFGLFAPA